MEQKIIVIKPEPDTQKGVDAMKYESKNEAELIVIEMKKRCKGCGKCKCKRNNKNQKTM